MNPETKIKSAIIQLQKTQPFFSFLLTKLTFREDTSGHVLSNNAVIGIDQTGTVWYKPEFMQNITMTFLRSFLVHELLHIILEHMDRGKHTNEFAWNIAIDLVVNSILLKDGFILWSDAIQPDRNDGFDAKVAGQHIILFDVSKKSAEQLYLECYLQCEDKPVDRLELHFFGSMPKEYKTEWKELMEHASNLLSHIGKITDGQNRVLEILGLKRTIDWRIALQSTMQQFVPTDYTFSRRNRKVRTAYLPTLEKKSFEVFVAIDTSGSVDSKLISAYLTEIAGIAQTYPNINLTLLDCDCRVHSVQKLAPSQLKNVTLKGNGGTSHKALFDYISLNRLKPKVLICFTDACSDINQCVQPPYKVIWVVPNKTKLPFGHIITMEM